MARIVIAIIAQKLKENSLTENLLDYLTPDPNRETYLRLLEEQGEGIATYAARLANCCSGDHPSYGDSSPPTLFDMRDGNALKAGCCWSIAAVNGMHTIQKPAYSQSVWSLPQSRDPEKLRAHFDMCDKYSAEALLSASYRKKASCEELFRVGARMRQGPFAFPCNLVHGGSLNGLGRVGIYKWDVNKQGAIPADDPRAEFVLNLRMAPLTEENMYKANLSSVPSVLAEVLLNASKRQVLVLNVFAIWRMLEAFRVPGLFSFWCKETVEPMESDSSGFDAVKDNLPDDVSAHCGPASLERYLGRTLTEKEASIFQQFPWLQTYAFSENDLIIQLGAYAKKKASFGSKACTLYTYMNRIRAFTELRHMLNAYGGFSDMNESTIRYRCSMMQMPSGNDSTISTKFVVLGATIKDREGSGVGTKQSLSEMKQAGTTGQDSVVVHNQAYFESLSDTELLGVLRAKVLDALPRVRSNHHKAWRAGMEYLCGEMKTCRAREIEGHEVDNEKSQLRKNMALYCIVAERVMVQSASLKFPVVADRDGKRVEILKNPFGLSNVRPGALVSPLVMLNVAPTHGITMHLSSATMPKRPSGETNDFGAYNWNDDEEDHSDDVSVAVSRPKFLAPEDISAHEYERMQQHSVEEDLSTMENKLSAIIGVDVRDFVTIVPEEGPVSEKRKRSTDDDGSAPTASEGATTTSVASHEDDGTELPSAAVQQEGSDASMTDAIDASECDRSPKRTRV